MTQDDATNVLYRKVSQGNRLRDSSAVTPTRALRLALGRVAEDLWDLAVVASDLRAADLAQETALSELVPDDLILVLTGPDGQCALAALDRSVLAGLIEIQTMGTVFSTQVVERPFTDTDASIAWLFIARLMQDVGQALGDLPDATLWQGFRFELRAEDARSAGLYVNAAQYRSYTVGVDMAGGSRVGVLRLFLPMRPKIPAPRARGDGVSQAHGNGFGLLAAPVTVQLCQLPIPLTRACRLRPGDLLDLPADALDRAVVRAAGGHLVARGRLGQMNGFRAISLTVPAGQQNDPAANADEVASAALVEQVHEPDPVSEFAIEESDAPLSFAPDLAMDSAEPEMAAAPDMDEAIQFDTDPALDGFPDWEEED